MYIINCKIVSIYWNVHDGDISCNPFDHPFNILEQVICAQTNMNLNELKRILNQTDA